MRIQHCSATVWGALSWQVRHEDMRSEELSQSACLFLLQETWLVQSQGHGLTARSRACKKCEKAQRLTKKWKECTASKEHRLGETTQQSLFARSDLWFSWKSKSYRMNSRRYRACFVVPWNEYTAQPAFLRLFCFGRIDGDEEKAPALQGKRYIWWIGNTIYTS